MKPWRIALAGLFGLLLIGAVLVWFLPARWALPLLSGRLNGIQLQDVSGSLWNGRAAQVLSAQGEPLGRLDWQLSRRVLLGDRQLRINLQGPRLSFSGRMAGTGAADALWTDVHLRTDLDLFGERLSLPMGKPRGTLQLTASQAQLRAGWPLALDAQLRWQQATLHTPRQGVLPLGEVQLTLHGSNGVIEGHLYDAGNGPLRIDGGLQASPLAWRFNAVAAPRDHAAPALRRWLASFGAADADGVTHIQYSGGLAAAMPKGTS